MPRGQAASLCIKIEIDVLTGDPFIHPGAHNVSKERHYRNMKEAAVAVARGDVVWVKAVDRAAFLSAWQEFKRAMSTGGGIEYGG